MKKIPPYALSMFDEGPAQKGYLTLGKVLLFPLEKTSNVLFVERSVAYHVSFLTKKCC